MALTVFLRIKPSSRFYTLIAPLREFHTIWFLATQVKQKTDNLANICVLDRRNFETAKDKLNIEVDKLQSKCSGCWTQSDQFPFILQFR